MHFFLRFHRKIAFHGSDTAVEWLFFIVLLPLSLIYGMITRIRNICYDKGLFPAYEAPVPVISVGNLAAGGTGKTPAVDFLLKKMGQQNKKLAVVSRGYGGTFTGAVGVVSDGISIRLSAKIAGDEPYLLAKNNPEVVVIISRQREAGIKKAVNDFGADVIVLDDGFQHRSVHRTVDLVLLDASRPLANGWPLPAGLLREFPEGVKRADLLLFTRSEPSRCFNVFGIPAYSCQHEIGETVSMLSGEQVKLSKFKDKKFFAFAGIADPHGFFSSISKRGLHLEKVMGLNDHVSYSQSLLQQIRTESDGCDVLITTEKDAVKLKLASFELPCLVVSVSLDVNNESDFMSSINELMES